MNKKALLASVLAATMLLSGCSLVVKDDAVDAATVIVKVGNHEYTKSEVQSDVNSYLNNLYSYYYSYYGYTIDITNSSIVADAQEYVTDSLVENAVIEDKMTELGIELTEDEQTEIDSTWQSYYDLFSSYYTDSEMTDEEKETAITSLISSYFGITKDSLKEEKLQEKFKAEVVKDVTVTEDEITEEYNTLVENAKSTYETTPSQYGTDVMNETTVYYRPAGYRLVKSILFQFSDEDSDKISDLTTKATEQGTAASTAKSAIEAMDLDYTALGVPEDTEDKVAYLADMVTVDVIATEQPVATAEPTAEPAAEAAEEAAAEPAPEATEEAVEVTEAPAEAAEEAVAEATEEAIAEPTPEPTPETETVLTADANTEKLPEGVTDELKEQLIAYKTALAEQEWYTNAVAEAQTAAYANIQEKVDAAAARLEAGEDFTTVQYELTEDPGMQEGATCAAAGYPICESSSTTNGGSMDDAYVAGAMALANVGDYATVASDNYGYFILQYAGDVTEGAVDLADVHDTIQADLLETKQDEYYDAQVEAWVEDANAKIDLNSLNN